MNDKTRIRIAVPAHLYESVKKQLTLKEGKQNFGGDFTVVKEKKSSSESKSGGSIPTSKAPKMEGEKTEKTLEERVAALEEMLDKAMKNRKNKTTDEGMENEIGYEKGNQKPDGEDDVNLTDKPTNDKKDK